MMLPGNCLEETDANRSNEINSMVERVLLFSNGSSEALSSIGTIPRCA